MVNSGELVFQGVGTLGKDSGDGLVFRGKGITLVTKMDGQFWTLLQSGQGMDAKIRIVSTEGAGSPPEDLGMGDAGVEGAPAP